jgi:hypothetical protein
VRDDGGDARPRVGKIGLEPRDGFVAIDGRRDAARDFERLGQLLETVGLIGPDEAE